jgi:tRNA (mo5U34)-methyltransferase
MTLQSSGRSTPDDDIGRRIAELGPWYHNLHLPSGHRTAADHPLGDFPAFKWALIEPHLPRDLRGRRALDIGCNAGFYSFRLAARGAHVLAFDMDEHYLEQARWAAQALDPEGRIDFRRMQVYDLVDLEERFDLVLFLGVLYHLRYPLLALDIVAERAGGTLILQTLTMPGAPTADVPADLSLAQRASLAASGWPRAAFIEHRLEGDPTNWWAPDDACVRAMARSAGLEVIAVAGHEIYVCEPRPTDREVASLREAELGAATRRSHANRSPPGRLQG